MRRNLFYSGGLDLSDAGEETCLMKCARCRPYLRRFRGPVERFPLRRFASILRAEMGPRGSGLEIPAAAAITEPPYGRANARPTSVFSHCWPEAMAEKGRGWSVL